MRLNSELLWSVSLFMIFYYHLLIGEVRTIRNETTDPIHGKYPLSQSLSNPGQAKRSRGGWPQRRTEPPRLEEARSTQCAKTSANNLHPTTAQRPNILLAPALTLPIRPLQLEARFRVPAVDGRKRSEDTRSTCSALQHVFTPCSKTLHHEHTGHCALQRSPLHPSKGFAGFCQNLKSNCKGR